MKHCYPSWNYAVNWCHLENCSQRPRNWLHEPFVKKQGLFTTEQLMESVYNHLSPTHVLMEEFSFVNDLWYSENSLCLHGKWPKLVFYRWLSICIFYPSKLFHISLSIAFFKKPIPVISKYVCVHVRTNYLIYSYYELKSDCPVVQNKQMINKAWQASLAI